MTDTATQEKISYVYDTVGRPSETRTEDGDNIFRVLYGYDEISRPNTLTYKYNNAYTQKYSTSYIADNRITLFKLNNGQSDVFSIVPTFDTLGRQTSRTLKNGSGAQVEKEDYAFLAGAGGANASTSMVSSVGYYGSDSTVDETYTYTYDNLGNIKTVSKNGTQIAAYTYNSFNMLTGYTDADGNTYTYGYSSGKNISETGKYLLFYTDDVWLDRVTCITDDASGKVFGITYDGIGNTLSYRDGMSFTWKNGRQLATFTQGQTSASYDYNESGIRNKKTVNGVTTTFQLAGSMIVSENRNGNIIQYYYNEAGSVIGLRYNGNDYFFRRNLQGDIISILNTAGQTVVSYEYDPWGNILSTEGSLASTLGVANPFRYRGYYYDTESGLYYLQTRYYDPAVGRFINADGYTSTGQGFLGNNMYAYCLNNPISYTDPSGRASRRVFVESQTEGAIIFQESIGNPERIPISKKKEVYGPSLRDVTDEIDKPLHVITFNVDPDWWKDVSAFKISGYVDINFNANAEISFELKAGYFDKNTNTFCPPAISFSPDISTERSCIPDVKEITKAHHNHLLNIASGSVILFALLFYLLYVGVKNEINVACVIVSILIISFVILTVWLILHSFRKRKALIIALNSQQSK